MFGLLLCCVIVVDAYLVGLQLCCCCCVLDSVLVIFCGLFCVGCVACVLVVVFVFVLFAVVVWRLCVKFVLACLFVRAAFLFGCFVCAIRHVLFVCCCCLLVSFGIVADVVCLCVNCGASMCECYVMCRCVMYSCVVVACVL